MHVSAEVKMLTQSTSRSQRKNTLNQKWSIYNTVATLLFSGKSNLAYILVAYT